MRPIILALTGVLAAALASCTTTAPDKFVSSDTDQSGAIGPKEFDAYMKKEIFERIDANGDGKITMEEWKAANPNAKASKFNQVDANGDGYITRAEGDAAFDRKGNLDELFKKIDTDGSGTLSRAEVTDFKGAVAAQPGFTKIQRLSQAAN